MSLMHTTHTLAQHKQQKRALLQLAVAQVGF